MKKATSLSFFLGMLITASLLTSCGGKSSDKQEQESVPKYEFQSLKPQDEQVNYQFPALLKGNKNIDIYPQVEGRITGVFYDNGDLVRKGQKLFTIEASQRQMQVNTNAANVKAAQATVNSAKLKLDSQKKLFDKGIVSEYVYRTAQNEYSTALAQLAQAKAQLNISKTDLHRCVVTSPITGIINGKDYNIGSLVGPNMASPLTKVSEQSSVNAFFSIPENLFTNVIKETGLEMTTSGYRSKNGKSLNDFLEFELLMSTGEKYSEKGEFRNISGMVDNQTGTVTCCVNFKNPLGLLHSGNSATIVIPMIAKGVFVVPQSACKKLQNKYLIYKVDASGKAQSVIIDVYPTDDGKSYILLENANLKAGDQILKTGVAKVTDGMKLK